MQALKVLNNILDFIVLKRIISLEIFICRLQNLEQLFVDKYCVSIINYMFYFCFPPHQQDGQT
jgi:hypothetical protein